ncbi:MAG: hypothetical protein M3406_01070 [Chloroflexota bacterium]|nr:hypothetical protein [Chloroflexota bacterium]
MNVRTVPLTPATVVFDATRRAGMAMDLALRIRRHGSLTYGAVAQFAALAAIPETDLRLLILPALSNAQMIELLTDDAGRVVEIEEAVGVSRPILEQASQVWEIFGPSDHERCLIASSDLLSYLPLTESAHRDVLQSEGHREELHVPAFKALRAVGMLRSEQSQRLGEPVLYSPYVWGSEAIRIGEFMQSLPPAEREVLGGLSRTVADRPGSSVDELAPSHALLSAARKVGLIDATRVVTTGGLDKAFAFSPAMETRLTTGAADTVHARKLFVAHILYGHRYGHPGTGRIVAPTVLVGSLIRNGSVGPATAIRTDYPLLEAQGIVRVREERTGRAYLELVQEDVARDALELLTMALGEDVSGKTESAIEALWVPGAFVTPEMDRARLPEVPAGAEAEVLGSAIARLREETARRMRAEEI